jgi:hypothetical protein
VDAECQRDRLLDGHRLSRGPTARASILSHGKPQRGTPAIKKVTSQWRLHRTNDLSQGGGRSCQLERRNELGLPGGQGSEALECVGDSRRVTDFVVEAEAFGEARVRFLVLTFSHGDLAQPFEGHGHLDRVPALPRHVQALLEVDLRHRIIPPPYSEQAQKHECERLGPFFAGRVSRFLRSLGKILRSCVVALAQGDPCKGPEAYRLVDSIVRCAGDCQRLLLIPTGRVEVATHPGV